MNEEPFRSYLAFFEWPWYMPSLSKYERIAGEHAEFDEVRIWEENADRIFNQDELVKWIDHPSLVPFLKHIPDTRQSAAFRNSWFRRCCRLPGTPSMSISKHSGD